MAARTTGAGRRASGPGSRADTVAARLRTDILSGLLEPGRRLPFPEMCTRYDASVGVLREALVRLVDRGIVRAESNIGFRVMALSDEDHDELTEVRARIEPAFVREAVRTGSARWEADVVAAHHLLDRTPIRVDGRINPGLIVAHAAFHETLVAGAGNRRMTELTGRLRDEADVYLRWYLDGDRLEGQRGRIADEDRAILAATIDRDADRAEALIRDHIRHRTDTRSDT